jgi:hypothetical protein
MATRIELFHVTVPAGTASTAPQETTLNAPDGVLERLQVFIPPGPSGLVGFRLHHSGQMVIPSSNADFIITDNEHIDWDMEGFPTGNRWSVVAYNTDVNPHTLEFRFLMRETPRPTASTTAPFIPVQTEQPMVVVE